MNFPKSKHLYFIQAMDLKNSIIRVDYYVCKDP